MDRREFLRSCGAIALGFYGLQLATSSTLSADPPKVGYGPLQDDPNGIIKLPKGFSYKIISGKGKKMTDGLYTPGRADGMAAFAGKNGRVVLIRNHELDPYSQEGPFGKNHTLLKKIDSALVYDYGEGISPSLGGTTTLVYNPKTQKVETEFLSLAGTNRNCAGGPTPWSSWISCEEDITLQGKKTHLEKTYHFAKNHGYTFEVPVSQTPALTPAIPLKGMGRFNHEAVAVSNTTSIVYQTEDRLEGLIYRYLPDVPKKLAKGGKLQALAIRGIKSADTRNWPELEQKFSKNKKFEVDWIDLEGIDPPQDDLRYRGFNQGAACFARGEGMWFGKNEVYFACTNGGSIRKGQIFRYHPSPYEGQPQEKKHPGKLEIFIEPNDAELLQYCDNLTIAPWGSIFICEDRLDPSIVGVTPEGKLFKFAQNIGHPSEFAGATFSPDGKQLFVNIQLPGITLAITGPW